MNTRLISPGSYALAVLFLIGVWLVIAPFVLQTQPAGVASWQVATLDDVAAGGVLMGVSLLGILVNAALSLSAAVHVRQNS